MDWYVKAEDIILKNKGNQNAGNPQNQQSIKKGSYTNRVRTTLSIILILLYHSLEK